MPESLGQSFTSLNRFLVVQFLVSGYLDTELISLFFLLTGASARFPSTSPLHCGLPGTSCRGAVQGVNRKKRLELFQQNLSENLCLEPLCSLLFWVGQYFIYWRYRRTGFWNLTVRDLHLFQRHPLHLFIFSGGTRELLGKEEMQVGPAGTTALFQGGVFGCTSWTSAVESAHAMGHPEQRTCFSWVSVASPKSSNKGWGVRGRINICHSLPCGDVCNSISPPWTLPWLLL